MANLLDEVTGPVNENGRDVNVIERQIPVTIGAESVIFEIAVCLCGCIPGLYVWLSGMKVENYVTALLILFVFLPPVIWGILKIHAKNYLNQLEQRIQSNASEIDNFLEQRVEIMKNLAQLVSKAVNLDSDVMKSVAAFRGGCGPISDINRSQISAQIDRNFSYLVPHVEAYPELKAHAAIGEAMRQNSYLQKEITAARTLYNDTVLLWNTQIFEWPLKQIVAARSGRTTRIPFSVSKEVKAQARGSFFE